jgi:phenylacetate-CoA ligase
VARGVSAQRAVALSAAIQARGLVQRTVPYWPLDLILQAQRARLRATVRHAYGTVPFYRQAMDERGLRPGDFRRAEDLQRLPLIDAAFVQEHKRDFISRAYEQAELAKYRTSGSESGVRRTIYWDPRSVLDVLAYLERVHPVVERLAGEPPAARALRMAVGETRAQALRRRVGRESRQVLIRPSDDPSAMREGTLTRETLMPARPGHIRYVSSRLPTERIVQEIDAARPRTVSSFGSVAEQVLRHLASSGARPALPRVWTYTGDGISQGARELAERRGCAVHSSYNATEVGRIGFQCERLGSHHLNIDTAPIAVVDPTGRPLPPGEPGEIVASSLRNRAMVLLNYRLGDSGVLGERACACGRTLPLLERLEGRSSSLLQLADGRRLSVLTVESMFRDELAPTLKVQLEEQAAGRLHWRIVPFEGIDRDALRGSLTERARRVLGPSTSLTVEFVEDIASTEGGKLRRLVRS